METVAAAYAVIMIIVGIVVMIACARLCYIEIQTIRLNRLGEMYGLDDET